MIVLPRGEEILDVICGDKDFWVITSTQNIAHVKPAKEGAATNLNRHGQRRVLFLLTEKNGTSMPDLKVYVNSDPNAPKGKPSLLQRGAGRRPASGTRGSTSGAWKPRTDALLNRSRASAGVSGEAAVLVRLSQVREALPGPIDLARRAVHHIERTQQNCLRSTK